MDFVVITIVLVICLLMVVIGAIGLALDIASGAAFRNHEPYKGREFKNASDQCEALCGILLCSLPIFVLIAAIIKRCLA